MVKNPPEGMPRITPYLFYNNLPKALGWLKKAFGLETRFSIPGPDGELMHAEMALADGVVMMGAANPKEGSMSPSDLKGIHQSLYIYVEDLDIHYRRSKEAGAQIDMEPEEMFWGDRVYSAKDLEGHIWTFAQHVKDVAPEDMKWPG